ncbi:major facilitator superfamily transporter [Klebsiella pneumoniae]|nr:major facilitator superfamily transporter [Klebsiella pneumoniae]VAP38402.1 major facilitator superfamily transporter [Klebsiella pneumoniae]
MDGLKAMFNPRLLAGAGITVLAYAGSFTLYTYISLILLQVTLVSESTSSLLMLGYGVMAPIGNIWGGRLTDRKGLMNSSCLNNVRISVLPLSTELNVQSGVS